ncbi:MAG: hypothetical protein JWP15_1471 [Alphaproteobacteria bacterium]|nr:hypothetical protein [Alphaproteobacteria bacterium]
MIYPARASILIAAAIAPFALLIGVVAPSYWFAGLIPTVFLLALTGIDGLIGGRAVTIDCEGPRVVGVGAEFDVEMFARFPGLAPGSCEIALDSHHLLHAPAGLIRTAQVEDGAAHAIVRFEALRRGTAQLEHVWVRWPGPFRLAWKQRRLTLGQALLIVPDIRAVRERSAQMLQHDAMMGLVAQLRLGEGAEFESLAEFQQGMDRRAIDWKQSARHHRLLGREYRSERNNNIVIALDSGRTMCEPIAGVARIDRAVSAALLTAFVALKDGDRVSLFGFDSHPRVSSRPVSGGRSFALLQRVAGEIDYSERETNYTLGLSTLATGLTRRSLVVIFTEFADTISAELMLNSVGRLLKRHLVLFILFRDEELEAFTGVEPESAEDVTRAVTASALLRQRRLVVNRLRRLGVHVVEAAHDQVGPALVGAYVDLKRRNLL